MYIDEQTQLSDDSHTASLVEQVARFGRLWLRHLHESVEHPSLNPARLRLLGALQVDGPQIMHSLAVALGSTPRNVTTLVDGLERDGLVRRTEHPTDRRATIVTLTDQGAELCASWWDGYQARAGAVLAALPEEDRLALGRIVGRLSDLLEDRPA